jgi:hypothetical protein
MRNLHRLSIVLILFCIGALATPHLSAVHPDSEPVGYQESTIMEVDLSLGQITSTLSFYWENIRSPPFEISYLYEPSFVSLSISGGPMYVSSGAWVSITLVNISVEEGKSIADSLCKELDDILDTSLAYVSNRSSDSFSIYSYNASYCPEGNLRDIFLEHKPSPGFGEILTPSPVQREGGWSFSIGLEKIGKGLFVWNIDASRLFTISPFQMEMNSEYAVSLKEIIGYGGSIESSFLASNSEIILRIYQRNTDFWLVNIETTPQMNLSKTSNNGWTAFDFSKTITNGSIEDLAIRFTCIPPQFDMLPATIALFGTYAIVVAVVALLPILVWYIRRTGIRLQDVFSLKVLTTALIFSGLGLSIIFRALSSIYPIAPEADFLLFGLTGLGTILVTFFFGYVCIKWLHIHRISWLRTNLNVLVPLAFGLYALSNLVGLFNSIPNLVQAFISYNYYQETFFVVDLFVSLGLLLVFGFSLLRVSSIALNKQGENIANLYMLIVICLGSYGILGTIRGVQWIYNTLASALTSRYEFLPNWSLLVSMIGNLLTSITILLLSIDVYRKKGFEKYSVYLTFFFIALSWLMQGIISLNSSIQNLSMAGYTQTWYSALAPIIQQTGVIATSLLTIIVSGSLLRGGRMASRNFKLSLAAILLYSVSGLLADTLTTFSSISSLILQRWLIFSGGSSLPVNLISLSGNIPILVIGLLLHRQSI